ncbi:MAG: SufD family Fe-S cluster assembly protein [Bacilli bacterium]
MNNNLKKLLNQVVPNIKDNMAYNIRYNASNIDTSSNINVRIEKKIDTIGLNIYIKDNSVETVSLPAIIDQAGIEDNITNDIYVGANSFVEILVGCAIENSCDVDTKHSGIHIFHIKENSKVHYIEKHYGCGSFFKRTINTTTLLDMSPSSHLEIDTSQIEGIDNTKRILKGAIPSDSSIIVNEKILTNFNQKASTSFNIKLFGKNSSATIISKSVAKDKSVQTFSSKVNGNNLCNGHVECNAVLLDNAKVTSTPKIVASNILATITHEAAIGKINEEQIMKLMTLGLSENEAQDIIIKSFIS